MQLTPSQVAELRSDTNVRGSIHASGEQRVLYLVVIAYTTLSRVQVLANARSLPNHVVWYVVTANPNRVELHTTAPEWFVELEEQMNAARRPVQPSY